MSEVIERLILIRESLGYNYDQINDYAFKLGYTNAQSYKNIEAGHNEVSGTLIKRLVNLFNINPEFLKSGDLSRMFKKINVDQKMSIDQRNVANEPMINYTRESEVDYLRRKLDELTVVLINLSNDKKSDTVDGA